MIWHVPPACAGQIVEVAYGDPCDGSLWRRTRDRSDGSVRYESADADSCGCDGECGCWSPQTAEPTGYDWSPADPPVEVAS